MMGGEIVQRFDSLCKKANIIVIVPGDIKGTCCGQIFSSKGFADAYSVTANNTVKKLWTSSREGLLPIVMDVTSCTQTLKGYRKVLTEENANRFDRLKILDVIDFAADILLPKLKITKPKDSVVFHPVCSAYKMGTVSKLQKIGSVCSVKSDIPLFAKCCGMAGDRGFYFPELTASATKPESDEVKQKNYDGYYSSSTTCEMALSEAVGKQYESILKLLDDVSD
jgi:D-lactate dehydrogenase